MYDQKTNQLRYKKRKLSLCNLKLVDKEKSLCEMNVLFRHLSLEKILYVYVWKEGGKLQSD